jgi:co-chaperonin GroES (HSP10)
MFHTVVEPGDKVLYKTDGDWSKHEVELEGTKHYLIDEHLILGVIEQ